MTTARSVFAKFISAATLFLIAAGGMVTSTDSGLAVPDWPLSYGQFFPPMVGGIFYEHGHRMIAGLVGLLILAQAIWCSIPGSEPRRWVRRLAWVAAFAVLGQALLGGATVLLLLPPEISIAHACLGQTVFTLTVCLAACTSPRWEEQPAPLPDGGVPSVRALTFGLAAAAALQLVLGALLRHTGMSVMPHVSGAGVVAILAIGAVARIFKRGPAAVALRGDAVRLAILLALQVGLGLAAWMARDLGPTVMPAVLIVTGHVAVGALLLAQAVVLAWQVARRTTAGLRAAAAAA